MAESPISTPVPARGSQHAAGADPKVIYVMGAGRSGSTILSVTLGNCDDVFYAGELDKWMGRSGVPPVAGPARTVFWKEVREAFEDTSELLDGETTRLIERSSAIVRLDRLRARRRVRGRYRRLAAHLYRAVARASGATHIVDTSHFPLRALEMRRLEGIDLYLVFLIRDPRSVVASYTRQLKRWDVAERRVTALRKNVDLWITHLLAVLVFVSHRRDRRIFVRHEEFLADPEHVLRAILDCAESPAAAPDFASLQTGVPFHGDRLIGSDTVALKAPPPVTARGFLTTTILQAPWSVVFSRLRPSAAVSSRAPAPERTSTRNIS